MRKNITKAKSFSVPLNNPVIAKGSGMKSNDNFFYVYYKDGGVDRGFQLFHN